MKTRRLVFHSTLVLHSFMFTMAIIAALCFYCAFLFYLFGPTFAKADSVHGDKTVGGLHFFEVHSPNGGTGIGIKIVIFLLLVGLAAFCYYKWRNFKKRLNVISTGATSLATTSAATLAANALNPRPALQPLDFYQSYPMSVLPQPQPCRHDRRRYERRSYRERHDSSELEAGPSARLP